MHGKSSKPDREQVSATLTLSKEPPQGSTDVRNIVQKPTVDLTVSKSKSQGIQTEEQEVVRAKTEDRGTQTDQEEGISVADKQAYCGFCNLQFGDRLMACMHQGVHAVDNPLRCNICGYVCQCKLDFFSHITWGHN